MIWPFGSSTNDSASVSSRRSLRSSAPSVLSRRGSQSGTSGRRRPRSIRSGGHLPSNSEASSFSFGTRQSRTGDALDRVRSVSRSARRSVSRRRKPKSTWDTTVDWLSHAGSTAMTAGGYICWAATYVPSMIQSTVGWAGRTIGMFKEGITSSQNSSREDDHRGRSQHPREYYPASSHHSGTVPTSAAPTSSTTTGLHSGIPPSTSVSTGYGTSKVNWGPPQ